MTNSDNFLSLFKEAAREIAQKEFTFLDWETRIDALGIDSVSLYEIFGYLEEELDLELDDEDLKNVRTLSDLRQLVIQP